MRFTEREIMYFNCVSKALLFSLILIAISGQLGVYAGDEQEDIKSAILRYKSAIEVNPSNPTTRLRLGRVYLMSGDLDGAAEQFRQTIKLNPNNAEAFFGLSRALARKKDFDGACSALKEAV